MSNRLWLGKCLATLWILLYLPSPSYAEVGDRSCLMCHKYAGLGRVDKVDPNSDQTVKRIFYVNEQLFNASYHGAIRCKSCHIGVDKIPHTNVKKVDCATDCHITDPSVARPFSHRKIVEDLRKSAHGELGSKKKHSDDLPKCKDCHTNKTYHVSVEEKAGVMRFKKVCIECHGSEEFVQRFYEHITYRTIKRRPSKDVVALCSQCHADRELMEKHDLDVVVGFQDTFHAKAISYGDEHVANCLSCHAPYQLGFSPHRITSRTEPDSPVNEDIKLQTCRQSDCHAKANEQFAAGSRVHPSATRVALTARTPLDRDTEKLDPEAAFQAKVIGWIQLFYKVLIAAVVGGLGMHRLLDMYATRRERRNGGH